MSRLGRGSCSRRLRRRSGCRGRPSRRGRPGTRRRAHGRPSTTWRGRGSILRHWRCWRCAILGSKRRARRRSLTIAGRRVVLRRCRRRRISARRRPGGRWVVRRGRPWDRRRRRSSKSSGGRIGIVGRVGRHRRWPLSSGRGNVARRWRSLGRRRRRRRGAPLVRPGRWRRLQIGLARERRRDGCNARRVPADWRLRHNGNIIPVSNILGFGWRGPSASSRRPRGGRLIEVWLGRTIATNRGRWVTLSLRGIAHARGVIRRRTAGRGRVLRGGRLVSEVAGLGGDSGGGLNMGVERA